MAALASHLQSQSFLRNFQQTPLTSQGHPQLQGRLGKQVLGGAHRHSDPTGSGGSVSKEEGGWGTVSMGRLIQDLPPKCKYRYMDSASEMCVKSQD